MIMQRAQNVSLVEELMKDFARSTGLHPDKDDPRRYLWTDAFALCNFLELFRRTGDDAYRVLAIDLIEQVHRSLGRHRRDDLREGWLSGMGEEEGKLHPTVGGLRIGKARNERKAGEVSDARLEWEQDGQYYHYLTKWMHGLERVGKVVHDDRYLEWAIELAKAANAAFIYDASAGRKAMYWKMSIDLSRPLVVSMGQHDPLDGLVTCLELRAASGPAPRPPGRDLESQIADLEVMSGSVSWATDDPLGLGGLLFDAYRVAQLVAAGDRDRLGLLDHILEAAVPSMDALISSGSLDLPASHRLPFRELGLSIGLRGVERLKSLTGREDDQLFLDHRSSALLDRLAGFVPLAGSIEQMWTGRDMWRTPAWREHGDINMVMLATSLAPDTFLQI